MKSCFIIMADMFAGTKPISTYVTAVFDNYDDFKTFWLDTVLKHSQPAEDDFKYYTEDEIFAENTVLAHSYDIPNPFGWSCVLSVKRITRFNEPIYSII